MDQLAKFSHRSTWTHRAAIDPYGPTHRAAIDQYGPTHRAAIVCIKHN